MRSGAGNCRSKPESWCHSPKKKILKHFVKGILKRKSPAPRLRKPGGKSLSEPCCSHSNTIYDAQLQNTIVYCVRSRSCEEPSCSHDIAFCSTTHMPRKSGGDQGTREGRRRDARAYIRPLGSAHCPTPATQKRRRPRDAGGTPEGRQGIHPTPWQCTLSHACHTKAAETKGHWRDAGGTPGRTFDPLAVHIAPRLPRNTM